MIGVNLQLLDGTTPRANLTGIQALWWDVLEPKDATQPIGKSSAVATDASGYINLDLSAVSGKAIGEFGLLTLYKLDGTDHQDSLVFTGRVAVSDITSGVDMHYYDDGWTRPADWPAIDAPVDGVQKFQGLWAVQDTPDQYIALSAAGAYTVDWGDGSAPEDIASGVIAQHLYDYSDVDLSAVTSMGYKCAVVTITPQSGQNLTALNIAIRPTVFTKNITNNWLDVSINGASMSALTVRGTTCESRMLEQCWIGEHSVTSISSMFRNCTSLQSVPLFNTAEVTNMSLMFSACTSLQSVPLFNTAKVTNMSYMFNACNSLQSVPLFNTVIVTDMGSMFDACNSLQSVPLFNTAKVTSMIFMFSNCTSLQSVPLFNTVIVTDMGSMFYNCTSLQSVPLFNTAKVTSINNMFHNCSSLQRSKITGTKIAHSYANCSLSADALNEIYTNLADVTATPRTITVTGNYGAATDDPTIATAKGWTVSG